MAGENLVATYTGFVMPKHCLYARHVNRIVTALKESGIMRHIFEKKALLRYAHFGTPGARDMSSSSLSPLSLITILSSLWFLAAMLTLSAAVFCLERCTISHVGGARKMRRSKKQQRRKMDRVFEVTSSRRIIKGTLIKYALEKSMEQGRQCDD